MISELETILVHTINFGDLEVPEDQIIEFKEGLPGFPQIHRFAILDLDEIRPFQYLQALDDPPIALLIINPFLIDPGYRFDLPDSIMDEVGIRNPKDVAVYAVATVPENAQDATLNLLAPVIVNPKDRLGKQVVLLETGYSVKHPLLKAANTSKVEATSE
jgi:flagellar assembly factor FliW